MDTTTAPRLTHQDVPATDLAAITSVIRDVEDGFNRIDPDLLTAHVAEDAVMVNARGARPLRPGPAGRAVVDRPPAEHARGRLTRGGRMT